MPPPISRAELQALLPYANAHQARVLQAYIDHGSQRAAAEALNVMQSSISAAVSRVQGRAARRGFAPGHNLVRPAPEGFRLDSASTYHPPSEEFPFGQWVRFRPDGNNLDDLIREAFDALRENVPKAKPVPPIKAKRSPDLLNLHIITDYHLGMKAWHEEAGEDWDLAIAEDLLVRWFSCAVQNAPPAGIGVLGQLGDFLHWDGMEAVTPVNRHVLDADTRFQKIVRVAIRALRRIVALMLQKYDRVHLIMADANHDPASGVWLREMFSSFYDSEPRITVDNSADTYYCLEHGSTSLFFHHGHKRKPATVDDVFVAKFREVFGRTKFSYAHLGHMHHDMKLETNLMTVEQHRTMAAKDAYASRGGWMSGRGAPVVTYHKEYGEVGRQVYTPEMI